MINVYLVDDHEVVRTGIRHLLDEVRGIKVVGESASGEDAVKWCRENYPDVILMDMEMPGMDGIEATKKIIRYNPDVKVIVLTAHTQDPFPTKVMQAGACGFLCKSAGPEEVINAIRMVNSGQRYLAPDVAQKIALSKFDNKSDNPFDQLSDRELQISLLITKGRKVADISTELSLSPKTVNSYRYRIFEKMSISGDVELTHLAIRHGVLDTSTI